MTEEKSCKNEETALADSPVTSATDEEMKYVIPGVTIEPRDSRAYVWIKPDFEVEFDGKRCKGTELSIAGFRIPADCSSNVTSNEGDFTLHIKLEGFNLELPVHACHINTQETISGPTSFYHFTRMPHQEHEALRRTIRAYLAGNIATVEEVVESGDAPTTDSRKTESKTADLSFRNLAVSFRQLPNRDQVLATIAVAGFISILLMAVTSIWGRISIIESEYAAVTAPSIEIHAPAAGEVVTASPVGETVARDDVVIQIHSAEIEAQRQVAAAELESLLADPTIGEPARELAMARVASLEYLVTRNTLHATCECIVVWSLTEGDWVQPGAPIVTLAQTQDSALLIEALVSIDQARLLRNGGRVSVVPPGGVPIDGWVSRISLDRPPHRRIGLSQWVRQDMSNVSVFIRTEEPLDIELIGVPLRVLFFRGRINRDHTRVTDYVEPLQSEQ